MDYVLPMALVGVIVGVSLFALGDSDLLSRFISNSLNGKTQDGMMVIDGAPTINPYTKAVTVIDSSGQSGDNNLPPTSTDSVIAISGGTIDFGQFQLSGIPDDFNSFVETSGAAGGTDKLSSLILQIADQLEQDGQLQESADLKELASLGHNIATFQKAYEDLYKTCNYSATCINQEVEAQGTSIFDGYEFDTTYASVPYDTDPLYTVSLGEMRMLQQNQGITQHLQAGSYSALMMTKFDQIMNNPQLDPVTKNVVEELYWDIGTISEDFETTISRIVKEQETANPPSYDPLTGETYTPEAATQRTFEEYLTSYRASSITNLDSALICAAGKHQDTGTKCH